MTVNRDGAARLAALAPNASSCSCRRWRRANLRLSAYAASKRAAEQTLTGRSVPGSRSARPAVYGPGDRETLTYFKMAEHGFALKPMRRGPGSP